MGLKRRPLFPLCQAAVKLIASVPGYHMGDAARLWGLGALREALREEIFPPEFRGAPLVAQVTSIGRCGSPPFAPFPLPALIARIM